MSETNSSGNLVFLIVALIGIIAVMLVYGAYPEIFPSIGQMPPTG